MNAVLAGRNLVLRVQHNAYGRRAVRVHMPDARIAAKHFRRVAWQNRFQEQHIPESGRLLSIAPRTGRCQWGSV